MPDVPGKLVFLASKRDAAGVQQVVVKFTQRYGSDTHKAWAEAGLVPQLIEEPTKLQGGWEQVQTEYLSPVIDKEEASGWLPMQHLLHANPSVLPDHILRLLPSPEESKLLLPRAQELLSAAQKVMVDGQPAAHGDACPDNILVFMRSRRIIELRLIDLDWAGKAEYPILLNTKSIQWPRGVAAGQALQQNHVVELLNLQASPETAFGSAEWWRQNTNLPFTMMSSISDEDMDTE